MRMRKLPFLHAARRSPTPPTSLHRRKLRRRKEIRLRITRHADPRGKAHAFPRKSAKRESEKHNAEQENKTKHVSIKIDGEVTNFEITEQWALQIFGTECEDHGFEAVIKVECEDCGAGNDDNDDDINTWTEQHVCNVDDIARMAWIDAHDNDEITEESLAKSWATLIWDKYFRDRR